MRLFYTYFALFSLSAVIAQHQDSVDFTHADVTIKIIPQHNKIQGLVHYSFKVLKAVDSVFLDARAMDITWVNFNGQRSNFDYDQNKIVLKKSFKVGEVHKLSINYSCIPEQTVYFVGYDDSIPNNEQIWTQGQGKYTSHWLPSFDDMNEKVEFDLAFANIPKGKTVMANGRPGTVKGDHNGGWITTFDMIAPMSSYLAAFAIGSFDKQTITSGSGIPIHLYYEPKDSLSVEPTYRHTRAIFDFLETEIGVPYPWQNYKQIPVQDFLYAGMENTGTTIFSNGYVIDSTAFVDKNYVNVNAHELAHQWFGNLVTEKSGEHHWLHEGFATYYAYLAERKLFGEDYYYWHLYDAANTLKNLSDNGDGDALTNPNADSLTFYEKGALALVVLKNEVGEEAFKEGIRNYLIKYKYANVTITDFLNEISAIAQKDLSEFKRDWLESDVLPWKAVADYFKGNNEWLGKYLSKMNAKEAIRSEDTLKAPSEYITHVMDRYKVELTLDDFNLLLRHPEIKVRQKAIFLLEKVPLALQQATEALLLDKSYVTVETALYKLWISFPEKASEYLDQTKDVVGLPNKNIRLLWLSLALATPNYLLEQKGKFYTELNGYTNAEHHFEIRQQAFQYLSQLRALNNKSYLNLLKATEHPVWQFKKSSKNLVRELYRSVDGKTSLDKLITTLPTEQQEKAKKLLAK